MEVDVEKMIKEEIENMQKEKENLAFASEQKLVKAETKFSNLIDVEETPTDKQNNKFIDTIFDKETTIKDTTNTLEKTGLWQAFKDKKNIKRNEKIQKARYFKNQESKQRVEISELKDTFQSVLTKEQISYYHNHKEVLLFMRMNTAHSLNHMKFIYWIGIIAYTILCILNSIAELCGSIIGLINVFFESAFGKKVLIGYDKNEKPIYEVQKLNIMTRIFIGLFVSAFLSYIALALINGFTGVDLIDMVKKFTKK